MDPLGLLILAGAAWTALRPRRNPIPGARYRVRTYPSGAKVRLAFKGPSRVVEARRINPAPEVHEALLALAHHHWRRLGAHASDEQWKCGVRRCPRMLVIHWNHRLVQVPGGATFRLAMLDELLDKHMRWHQRENPPRTPAALWRLAQVAKKSASPSEAVAWEIARKLTRQERDLIIAWLVEADPPELHSGWTTDKIIAAVARRLAGM